MAPGMCFQSSSHPHPNCFDPPSPSELSRAIPTLSALPQMPQSTSSPSLSSFPCSPGLSELLFHQLPGCLVRHASAKDQPSISAAASLPTLTHWLQSRTSLLVPCGHGSVTPHAPGAPSTPLGLVCFLLLHPAALPALHLLQTQRVILPNPNLVLAPPRWKPFHDSPVPLGQK